MQLISTLVVATLAVFGHVAQGTTSALRASVFQEYFTNQNSGRWGFMTGCANSQAVNSICSSGRNADCDNEYTRIRCGSNSRDMLSPHGEPSILRTSSWGEYAKCGANEVIVGVCSSGKNRDCDYNRGKGPTAVGCHKLSPNYYLSSLTADIRNECCGYGVTCSCPRGYYATQICTSGEDANCGTEICTHRRRNTYTGLRCVKVVKKEALVVEGQWNDIGNTVQDSTYEVSYFNERGVSSTESRTISNELSVSLEIGAEFEFVGGQSSVSTTFSQSFTNEVTRDVRNSITQTVSTSCSPREDLAGDVEKLGVKWQEHKGFRMPSTALRYYKYKMSVRAGSVPRAVLDTCDYIVLYSGMEPQCPPEACKDLPLCQTCCTEGRNIKQCRSSEIVQSDFETALK